MKDTYDAFNLDDPRLDAQLDPTPVFMTMRLDRALLGSVNSINGGKGTAQYRRALDTSVFAGPWAYVDHLVLAPGASIGPHLHHEVAEVYYVMKGHGTASVSAQRGKPESASVREGDAVPIQLNEVHSFENDGSEPLEFMIIGISRDSTKRVDSIDARDMASRRN